MGSLSTCQLVFQEDYVLWVNYVTTFEIEGPGAQGTCIRLESNVLNLKVLG